MDDKTQQAYDLAREFITDALPAVYDMTTVAEHVASNTGVTVSTARNRLRKAVENGRLLELKPGYGFQATLPGADTAGIRDLYFVVQRPTDGSQRRLDSTPSILIARDPKREKQRPSSYGPGRTTYLITPEGAAEVIKGYMDADKAAEDARNAEEAARKKAERAEIRRRQPGLWNLMRRLDWLILGGGDGSERVVTDSRVRLLHGIRREGLPVEELPLGLNADTFDDAGSAVLRAILEAGVKAYIAEQPAIDCAHCAQRILSFKQRGETVWWHVESTSTKCKDADTRAEPAKEN
jgi:hypothetical protein